MAIISRSSAVLVSLSITLTVLAFDRHAETFVPQEEGMILQTEVADQDASEQAAPETDVGQEETTEWGAKDPATILSAEKSARDTVEQAEMMDAALPSDVRGKATMEAVEKQEKTKAAQQSDVSEEVNQRADGNPAAEIGETTEVEHAAKDAAEKQISDEAAGKDVDEEWPKTDSEDAAEQLEWLLAAFVVAAAVLQAGEEDDLARQCKWLLVASLPATWIVLGLQWHKLVVVGAAATAVTSLPAFVAVAVAAAAAAIAKDQGLGNIVELLFFASLPATWMCIEMASSGLRWHQFPVSLATAAATTAAVASAAAAAAAATTQVSVDDAVVKQLELYFTASVPAAWMVTELCALASSTLRWHQFPVVVATATMVTAVAAFIMLVAAAVARTYGVGEGVAAVVSLPALWCIFEVSASVSSKASTKESEEKTQQHRTREVILEPPVSTSKVAETPLQQEQEIEARTLEERLEIPTEESAIEAAAKEAVPNATQETVEKEAATEAGDEPRGKEAAEKAADEPVATEAANNAATDTSDDAPAQTKAAEETAEEAVEQEAADEAAKDALATLVDEAAKEAPEVARKESAAAKVDMDKEASAVASRANEEATVVAAKQSERKLSAEEEPAQDAARSSDSSEPDPEAALAVEPAPQAQAPSRRKRDGLRRGLSRVFGGRATQCFRRPHVEPISAPQRRAGTC